MIPDSDGVQFQEHMTRPSALPEPDLQHLLVVGLDGEGSVQSQKSMVFLHLTPAPVALVTDAGQSGPIR